MRIALTYFDDCPNWQVAYERLAVALVTAGLEDTVIERALVTSEEEAVTLGFAGSPTILVDGVDPFREEAPHAGLSCRLYMTPDGMQGAPSVDQIAAVLTRGRPS
jgi:hypothetical protein